MYTTEDLIANLPDFERVRIRGGQTPFQKPVLPGEERLLPEMQDKLQRSLPPVRKAQLDVESFLEDYMSGMASPMGDVVAQVGSIPARDVGGVPYNTAEDRLFGGSPGVRTSGGFVIPDRSDAARNAKADIESYVRNPSYGAPRGLMQTVPLAIQQMTSPFGIQKMLGLR
jgi:hypothetical protein